jgi:septum formation protein
LKLNHQEIVLASASPRREDLLRQAGLNCRVIVSHAEEVTHEYLTPRELAQLNAYRKARVVAKRHPDVLVLGADTLVCLGMRVFGKPSSRKEAVQMLKRLQGKTHQVITGMCLLQLRRHRQRLVADSTDVTFRPLDEVQILHYLDQIDPLDKAGAYAIQQSGELIVECIEGSLNNVIGLPTELLMSELEQWPD